MAKKGIDGNAKRTSAINYTPSSLGFIMISALPTNLPAIAFTILCAYADVYLRPTLASFSTSIPSTFSPFYR